MAEPQTAGDFRVSTLELFFDLVFVFIITQLAETLYEHPTPAAFGDVTLILAVVWWMYSGYAWLTNAVAPNSATRRTLLLIGMAGFLLMAIAIPEAFGEYGWLFGASYLVVNIVHAVLFLRGCAPGHAGGHPAQHPGRATGAGRRRAARAVAARVLGGGTAGAGAAGTRNRVEMHSIAAGHFAERHGLVVIVAIGESIVAIGLGFAGKRLGPGAILVAVLGLTIAYYLWWFYFAGDDERAEHVLARTATVRAGTAGAARATGTPTSRCCSASWWRRSASRRSSGTPSTRLRWGEAIILSAAASRCTWPGTASFSGCSACAACGIRVAAAVLVLATVPLGHVVAIAQLAAIPLIMVAAAITEDIPEIRRSGPAAIGDFGRGTTD